MLYFALYIMSGISGVPCSLSRVLLYPVLSFFPRDVLDEIMNLIESVSESFPTYYGRRADTAYLKQVMNKPL